MCVNILVFTVYCVQHLFCSCRSRSLTSVWFHVWYNKCRCSQSDMLHCSIQKEQVTNWHYGYPQTNVNQRLWTVCFGKCHCIMCRGKLPQCKDYNIQKDMRSHLIKCLKDSTPSPFPSIHRDMLHGDIEETKLVSLRCSCRLLKITEKEWSNVHTVMFGITKTVRWLNLKLGQIKIILGSAESITKGFTSQLCSLSLIHLVNNNYCHH